MLEASAIFTKIQITKLLFEKENKEVIVFSSLFTRKVKH